MSLLNYVHKNIRSKIKFSDFFGFINFNKYLPNQGWKVHISATSYNYKKLLKIVSSLCFQNKIDFKFIKSFALYKKTLYKKFDRTQSGKFITIYFSNEEEFKKIILLLYKNIPINYSGPRVLTDLPYKNSKIIYYRYGSYNSNNFIYDLEGKKIEDKRLPYFNDFGFIKIPFDVCNNKKYQKLENYEFIEAIQFSNAGGIYKAKRKLDNKMCLIKEARKHIYDDIFKNTQSYKLRLNEYKILKMYNNSFLPKVIENFRVEDNYFFVYEFIDGKQLSYISYLNAYPSFNFKNITKTIKSNDIFIKIANQLWEFINFFESNNIVINDISESNFIFDDNLNLYLIDLEHSIKNDKNNKSHKYIKNVFYTDNRDCSHRSDYIKISYMLLEIMFCSNSLLKNDRTANKLINKINWLCKLYKIDSNLINKVLKYIDIKNFNNVIDNQLINVYIDSKAFDDNAIDLIVDNIKFLNNLSNITINDIKKLTKIEFESKIKLILENVIEENGMYYYKVNNVFYPGILNGINFILLFLLFYKYKFTTKKYNNLINQIIDSQCIFMNKFDIYYGSTSYLLVCIIIYKLYKKKILDYKTLNNILINYKFHSFIEEKSKKQNVVTYKFNEHDENEIENINLLINYITRNKLWK